MQTRTNPPATGDPVDQAMAFYRFLWETLFRKCAGLTEEQLRSSPLPSGMCLLGMLKHSVNVERWWIAKTIGHLDVSFDWDNEVTHSEWIPLPGETLASMRALYEAEAARSAQVLVGVEWDDIRYPDLTRILVEGNQVLVGARWVPVPPDAPPATVARNVGWNLLHLIEETGRHCGHADVIRELIDGQTGE